MKKFLSVLLCLVLLASMALSAGAKVVLDEAAVVDFVHEEFKGIAAIPRPSSHTEAISEYLYQWGLSHSFESVKDEVGNVVWEIPASAGFESAPLTVLQVHSDMVCVSDDPNWDGVVTLIKTDDGFFKADGTSLGGDDGIGITSAMFLITSEAVVHGPMRVIITINEEGGEPSGVGNLDHATVTDAQFLINIDSEEYGICTVAACGFNGFSFSGTLNWADVNAQGKVAYAIDLKGLTGGHSGVDIHKNRANAIKAVDYCMAWAKYNGIDIELASFTGGTGMTAIPKLASAVIVIKEADAEKFAQLMDKTIATFTAQYMPTEPNFTFTYGATDMPAKALSVEESSHLIDLVAAVEDGINGVSQRYEGITESSFNVGIVNFTSDSDAMSFYVPMRLNAAWPALVANMEFAAIANAFGYEMEVSDDLYMGWVEREGDVIAEYYAKAFKEYTGDDCIVTAVHGGLECADFADWNDKLQIVSVGPTVIDPHSTSERVPIDTIAPTIGSIATLLQYIADGTLSV